MITASTVASVLDQWQALWARQDANRAAAFRALLSDWAGVPHPPEVDLPCLSPLLHPGVPHEIPISRALHRALDGGGSAELRRQVVQAVLERVVGAEGSEERRGRLLQVLAELQGGPRVRVAREFAGPAARVDLVVRSKRFVLGFEVKRYSGETRGDQTLREWSDLKALGLPITAGILLAPMEMRPSSPEFSVMTFYEASVVFEDVAAKVIAARSDTPERDAWQYAWFKSLAHELRRY